MDKKGGISLFGSAPDYIKRAVVEIATIGTVAMLVSVDVRADLDSK
jgi:hypothetical protein